jgi:outer membrane protein assembly factor BamB
VSSPRPDSPGVGGPGGGPSTARQPHDATIVYPGGLRARWRWGGSGEGAAVFALTEAGGPLTDHGTLAGSGFDELCRAELRIDGPAGSWTVRLASLIYDEPAAVAWDDHGLLVVKYGFLTYGFAGRSGELRWSHKSASPLLAVLGSPRLDHILVQSEIETFALEPDGAVAWRVAHSDVVTAVELVGGRLVLTSFAGQVSALDPVTGRETG